jgi:hypothetical protein
MGEPNPALIREALGYALSKGKELLYPAYTETGDYAPEQWQDWYQQSQLWGTPQHRQHQDYLHRAVPRLKARLAEFDPEADLSDPAYDMMVRNVVDSLLGLPYDKSHQASNIYRQEFLNWMRQTSLGGEEAPDASITPEGYEQWGQDPSLRARVNQDNRLTPTGQESLAKLKDYNLFRAFQMGEHRPNAMQAQMMQVPFGVMGSLYSGLTGSDWQTPMNQIMAAGADPSPLSALRYTLDWDRRGQEADPEYFRDYFSGANVPQASLMDAAEGMERSFNSGDTAFGRATRNMTNILWMPNHSRATRQNLNDFVNRQHRLTPIGYPEEYEKEQARREAGQNRLIDEARDLEGSNWAQPATYLPKWIRDINSVVAAAPQTWGGEMPQAPLGYKWETAPGLAPPRLVPASKEEREYQELQGVQNDPDPYAKVGITPFYGTQALNSLVGVGPAIFGDPLNAAFTATLAPIVGIAGRSPAAALKFAAASNVGDIPAEAAFNTAVDLSISPQSPFQYFTEPAPSIPLQRIGGELPAPDTTDYTRKLQDWEEGKKETLSNIGQRQRIFNMDEKARQMPKSVAQSLLDEAAPVTSPSRASFLNRPARPRSPLSQ